MYYESRNFPVIRVKNLASEIDKLEMFNVNLRINTMRVVRQENSILIQMEIMYNSLALSVLVAS